MSGFLICRVLILFIYICSIIKPSFGIVHLKSISTSFLDTPARFGARINSSGICGALVVADPLDACSSLINSGFQFDDPSALKFVLIIRGNCTFLDKIRNAQVAGFDAAIVFDHQVQGNSIAMIGSSEGIWMPAVFVSNEAGETLMKHAQGEPDECCIISLLGETSWNVLIISFISLLVIVSVLTAFVVVRIYWRNQQTSSNLVDGKLVELLPCLIYCSEHISGYMEKNCAICLQDYTDGDNLKILPCRHKFHTNCVESWLTKWNTFCPVCKYDLMTEVAQLQVSERRRGLVS